jgi:hypothetical protein
MISDKNVILKFYESNYLGLLISTNMPYDIAPLLSDAYSVDTGNN